MALIFSCVSADILFALSVVIIGLYFYFNHKYKHWKKQGIHYVQPTFFFGNLGTVFLARESLVDLFGRIYREAVGHKVIGIFVFNQPFLVVRDLDMVRSVLAKDAHAFLNKSITEPARFDRLFAKTLVAAKGRKWKHLRTKLAPGFTSGRMKAIFQLIEEICNHLLTHIDQEVSEGRPVVVKKTTSRYTMDAIASCAFGVDTNSLENPNHKFITIMKTFFEPSAIQMIFISIMLFIPGLHHLVGAKYIANAFNNYVRKTFWEVVNYRQTKGIVRKDFMDLLMQLREVGEGHAEDAKDFGEIKQDSKYLNLEHSKTNNSDIRLDDDDIIAQAYIFIAAGIETSSSAMSFTLFELALNPAIQDKLRQEIEEVLEKHDNKVTYDAMAEMSYLDMVIAESMRKYPPLHFLDRECLSDYKIEGTDIRVEKGTRILICTHSIHHDPDIFPEPEKFDPERFNAENKGSRSCFAHLPFGAGPRKCIGMRFALLQVKAGLVNILKTFLVRPCKDTPEPPLEMKPIYGPLTPKKKIILSFMKLR